MTFLIWWVVGLLGTSLIIFIEWQSGRDVSLGQLCISIFASIFGFVWVLVVLILILVGFKDVTVLEGKKPLDKM